MRLAARQSWPEVANLANRALHGFAEIGVGEDQEGSVAAQLQDQSLHRLGSLARDQAADLRGAGEGEGAHLGVGAKRRADRLRRAGHDVEETGGQARALGQLGQRQGGEGRLGRGVDHGRAARGQRGGSLAGDHGRGEVPGRDERGHAQRLALQGHLRIGQVAGDALDVQALGLLGVEEKEGGGVVDLAARLGQRLALLQHHQEGEVLLGREHLGMPGVEQARALLRQGRAPGGEGLVGGLDGARRLIRAHCRDVAQKAAVGGVGDRQALAVVGGLPLAVDIGQFAPKAGVFKQAGSVGAVQGAEL